MSLSFEQPLWLLSLVAALPLAWLGLRWFNTMSRARAWSAVMARLILLTLLAAALAGAANVRTSRRLAVIGVVDVSDSVRQFAPFSAAQGSAAGRPTGATDAIRDWFERASARAADRPDGLGRGPEDLFGLVVFDGRTLAVATPQAGRFDALTLDYRAAEGTDIERALRFAAALVPPDAAGRLVLVSDGNETSGDALAAARELGQGGSRSLPIDILPITYRVSNEVAVEAVDAPPQAAAGATVTLRVVLRATDAASGTLEVMYEGSPLDLNGAAPGTGRRLTLKPGRTVELVEVKLSQGVIHRLEPVFVGDTEASDRLAANNRAQTFVVTPGKGAVLVIDGVSRGDPNGAGATLARTLREAGIDAETVSPEQAPMDVLSIQAYSLVVLQNVAAEDLPRSTHRMLADYVTDMDGGLIMVGGPDSFGAGGWKGTAIEPILPVKLDLPEQLIMPAAAVMLVLDSSGSMRQPVLGGSRSQQDVANESAALAIQTLDRSDLVGVIEFNSDHRVVIPLAPNKEPRASADRVRQISPGGGTSLYPALKRALVELQKTKASVRHVIALTDGRSEGDPEQGIRIARELSDAGITLSTIAIGDASDTATLARLAQAGRGQYYEVIDPKLLPRIFVKEIRVVRKPLIREAPFVPLAAPGGSPLLRGVEYPPPALLGLVLTQSRDDPKVTTALLTPEGEPVLAHWRAGRGQAAAFTSDAHDDWARRWIDWPGYSVLWAQIARGLSRPVGGRGAQLRTEVVGDELIVQLEATDDDGNPRDLLNVPGWVNKPDGTRAPINLVQTGPGTYEARTPSLQQGNYVVALSPSQSDERLPPVWGGATRAIGPEFSRLSSNVALLRQIAESTSGRPLDVARPEDANLWDRAGLTPSRASLPLWPALVAWAIGVFLLDVGTRRVAWDRLASKALLEEVRGEAARSVRERGRRAAGTLAALRKSGGRPAATPPAVPAPGAPSAISQAVAARAAATGAPTAGIAESDNERAERERLEAAEQEERRVRLRAQMLRRVEQRGDGPAVGPAEESPPARESPDSGSTTGDLLAAKRRARERYGGKP